MRLINPFNTLPGPISSTRRQPDGINFMTDSSQRTGCTACSIKRVLTRLGFSVDLGLDVGNHTDGKRLDRHVAQDFL